MIRRLSANAGGTAEQEAAIARLHAAFIEASEACYETFEPTLGDDGMLLLDLGPKGQFSVQSADGGRLLLFSAISGPKYYSYDEANGWWSDPNDGHLLDELLVRELMHITSVCLNL